MESKSIKYTPRTIYLDKENIEKLDKMVQETGLNSSQIFRRIIHLINIEEIETKEEKFKRLSKSGKGSLFKKPKNFEKIHMNELAGIIKDGEPINSVEATRQIRKGDYK